MERLNTTARIAVKCILGKARCRSYLEPIERLLLDNYDEASIRGIARRGMIPESTLRCILEEVRKEMQWVCASENLTPEQLLAEPET